MPLRRRPNGAPYCRGNSVPLRRRSNGAPYGRGNNIIRGRRRRAIVFLVIASADASARAPSRVPLRRRPKEAPYGRGNSLIRGCRRRAILVAATASADASARPLSRVPLRRRHKWSSYSSGNNLFGGKKEGDACSWSPRSVVRDLYIFNIPSSVLFWFPGSPGRPGADGASNFPLFSFRRSIRTKTASLQFHTFCLLVCLSHHQCGCDRRHLCMAAVVSLSPPSSTRCGCDRYTPARTPPAVSFSAFVATARIAARLRQMFGRRYCG